MVLTVTLNPLLEKKLFFGTNPKENNRAYKQEYLAGGKGINVSRQLDLLGIKNHALLFLGGANGKKLRAVLENENISFSAVSTKAETREATLIFDEENKNLQTFFGVNSEISESEIDHFIVKLEKAIINSSIVIFSGSLPSVACSKIIERGLEFCNKHDKISILDSYGETLDKQIKLGPTVLHNNKNEIFNSLGFPINDDDEAEDVLNHLYKNGVKLSFITSGKNETYAAKSDFHYKIKNPKIVEKDSTGSGDAFIAGIIYGLEKQLVFDEFSKLAASIGAQNATSWDVCKINKKDMKNLVEKVKIEGIGKKIKLIDDSPTI